MSIPPFDYLLYTKKFFKILLCFTLLFFFSDQLDAIALKKLVIFVNELMEQYFNAVQQRVRLEVCIYLDILLHSNGEVNRHNNMIQ